MCTAQEQWHLVQLSSQSLQVHRHTQPIQLHPLGLSSAHHRKGNHPTEIHWSCHSAIPRLHLSGPPTPTIKAAQIQAEGMHAPASRTTQQAGSPLILLCYLKVGKSSLLESMNTGEDQQCLLQQAPVAVVSHIAKQQPITLPMKSTVMPEHTNWPTCDMLPHHPLAICCTHTPSGTNGRNGRNCTSPA